MGENIVDSSGSGWDDEIHRTWSLLELLQMSAEAFVAMGGLFFFWENYRDENRQGPSSSPLSNPHFEIYKSCLHGLKKNAEIAGLETSIKLISKELSGLTDQPISSSSACQKMGELHRCVDAELESRYFFLVPAHRAKYLVLVDAKVSAFNRDTQITTLGSEIGRFTPIIKK
ncbi:MAG: hypothetical protein WBW33_19395, partial [Bryobacteraceae bacterium]